MLVGVFFFFFFFFFTYYGRVAAILVGLLFSFLNEHLDEPVKMLSFPPSTSVSMGRGLGLIRSNIL